MIRHIVLLKARPEVTEAQIQAIFAGLQALRLPGILAIHSGRSESPEQIERGYLHGFTVDFADWDSLATYQAHPDHKRVGAALVAAAQGGLDGILVFDLPIASQP
ncbi:MAG: Dabb family protein [Fuscovulum sp.]|nr:Dabb family protein [Fuscovulum sp.]